MKHGMTVSSDDTTEYDTQSNGLAEVAVREVEGVARSIRVGSSLRKMSTRNTRCCPGSSLTLLARSRVEGSEQMG